MNSSKYPSTKSIVPNSAPSTSTTRLAKKATATDTCQKSDAKEPDSNANDDDDIVLMMAIAMLWMLMLITLSVISPRCTQESR